MKEFFETAAGAVELAGIALLLVGFTLALARFLYRSLREGEKTGAYAGLLPELLAGGGDQQELAVAGPRRRAGEGLDQSVSWREE